MRRYLAPALRAHTLRRSVVAWLGPGTAVAIAAVVLAVVLLYRNLASLRVVSYVAVVHGASRRSVGSW